MARAKLKFRLHRAVIVLICLALLVALMQGASGLARITNDSVTHSLKNWPVRWRAVTLNVAPSMRTETPDDKRIAQVLRQLTENSRILDAGVYDEQGDLIARAGEHVDVRDRLALDGKKLAVISINKSLNPFRARMAHSAIYV